MVSAFIALLGPKLLGILAAFVAMIAWGFNQRLVGARKERAKQAAAEAKANDISNDVDNDLGALTPEQRREALKKWSKS